MSATTPNVQAMCDLLWPAMPVLQKLAAHASCATHDGAAL